MNLFLLSVIYQKPDRYCSYSRSGRKLYFVITRARGLLLKGNRVICTRFYESERSADGGCSSFYLFIYFLSLVRGQSSDVHSKLSGINSI